MSPEQMLALPVDPRTDIWGLGAVMFECVAGRPAFLGSTIFEISAHVLSDPLPNLRSLAPELSEEFVRIVEYCLQRDPAHRFQTVAGLAQALEPLAASNSVSAAVRIACLLGLDAPSPTSAVERSVSQVVLNSIGTTLSTPRSISRVQRHSAVWAWAVFVMVALLGSCGYRYPAATTRVVVEVRHQASSLVAFFSR
jgi:serine/threonine protein kinase